MLKVRGLQRTSSRVHTTSETLFIAKKKEHYMLRFPESSVKLVSLVKQCSKKYRFIALPIYITFDDCKKSGHMNTILFDTKTNEIERFEPYGIKGYTKKDKTKYWDGLTVVRLRPGGHVPHKQKPVDARFHAAE